MKRRDAEAVKKQLSHLIQGVSPQVRTNVQMMYGARNWAGNVQGVSTDILLISNIGLAEADPVLSKSRFFEQGYCRVPLHFRIGSDHQVRTSLKQAKRNVEAETGSTSGHDTDLPLYK